MKETDSKQTKYKKYEDRRFLQMVADQCEDLETTLHIFM